MNNIAAIMEIIDEHGLKNVDELVSHTKIAKMSVRTAIRQALNYGYVQCVKMADETGRIRSYYAGTTKEYVEGKQHRVPVALYANDGCVWVFPSISHAAEFKRVSQPSVWRSMKRRHKLRGERIEELNP